MLFCYIIFVIRNDKILNAGRLLILIRMDSISVNSLVSSCWLSDTILAPRLFVCSHSKSLVKQTLPIPRSNYNLVGHILIKMYPNIIRFNRFLKWNLLQQFFSSFCIKRKFPKLYLFRNQIMWKCVFFSSRYTSSFSFPSQSLVFTLLVKLDAPKTNNKTYLHFLLLFSGFLF